MVARIVILLLLFPPAAASGADWTVAESPNFRIFHTQSTETGARAARIAEQARRTAAVTWLGQRLPDWPRKCDIYLHPSTADYTRATPAPPGAQGHSSVQSENGRLVSLRIDLSCEAAEALTSVLPHEATHVVLLARFGPRDLPRWADEGMAVLSEPRSQVAGRRRELARARTDDALFRVAELMSMTRPPAGRLGVFYSQSASLVEFLSKQKKPAVLTRFLRLSLIDGYESALEACYGYRTFAALERDWLRHAFAAE